MSDLISRKAAMTAIERHIRTAEEPYQLAETDKVMNHAFEVATSCLMNLPSVQPDLQPTCNQQYQQTGGDRRREPCSDKKGGAVVDTRVAIFRTKKWKVGRNM